MNASLVNTLRELKTDPSVAIRLYEELFGAAYYALVRIGTGSSLTSMEFLTYDTVDGVRELPVFTEEEFVLGNLNDEAEPALIHGAELWARLIDIIETGKCEVGVDAGQGHGIRLNKEMVLGMVSMYGAKNTEGLS